MSARHFPLKTVEPFFINGRMGVGAQPYEVFKQVIDEELSK